MPIFVLSFFFPLFPCFFQCLNALLRDRTTALLYRKSGHSNNTDASFRYGDLRLITFSIFMPKYLQTYVAY